MHPKFTVVLQVLCMCLLFVVPLHIIKAHYSPDSRFLGLIYFGQRFVPSQLPEVAALSPPALSPWGYDGQFYAQIALRPALLEQDIIEALDNPSYRARRIGLPMMAHILGMGVPGWTMHVYSMLNFVFWVLLFASTAYFIGHRRVRDFFLMISMLWSTGTLASIARSLTDFPAAVLGVMALLLRDRGYVPAFLLSMTALMKEASVLGFAAVVWPWREKEKKWRRLIVSGLIMALPVVLWVLYVQMRVSSGSSAGTGNFSFPLTGFFQKVSHAFHLLTTGLSGKPPGGKLDLIFELLSPLSLFAQSIYFCVKPRFASTTWRFGIGFVVLFALLGGSVWQEQFAYTRVLLPLTFAFNLLLHENEQGKQLAVWYVLGNMGMFWIALKTLGAVLG